MRSFLGPVAAPRLKVHSPKGCSAPRDDCKLVAAHVHVGFFVRGGCDCGFMYFMHNQES